MVSFQCLNPEIVRALIPIQPRKANQFMLKTEASNRALKLYVVKSNRPKITRKTTENLTRG